MRPTINVWASGTKDGGGSGFENLVKHSRDPKGDLKADIVGVISNIPDGGVYKRAKALGVPFHHFAGPWTPEGHQRIVAKSGGEFNALSGYLRLVRGLPLETTFNIHPGLLTHRFSDDTPRYGGRNMHGNFVHEAVKRDMDTGIIQPYSGFTMHFVDDEYDHGPHIFLCWIELRRNMTAEEIGKAVNAAEHRWQPKITNLIVHRQIFLKEGNVVWPKGFMPIHHDK